MSASSLPTWMVLAACSSTFLPGTDATKCLKDKLLAEYDINVYWCNETDKPLCCEEEQEFTCCATKTVTGLIDQLQLWLPVGAVVGILFALCICWKRDQFFCEGSTIKEQWNNMCSCCKKRKRDDEKEIPGDSVRDTRQINPVMHFDEPVPSGTTFDHLSPDGAEEDSGRGSALSSAHPSPKRSASRAQSSFQRSRRNGQGSRASLPGPSDDCY